MCDLSAALYTLPTHYQKALTIFGLNNVDASYTKSSMKGIKEGVVQGSMAGPLLFIIFFNDFICIFTDESNYKI